jgi:hypothetical protein
MDQAFHHFPGSPLEFWLEENRSRLAGTTGQTDPGSSPSPDPLRLGHGNSHTNLVALPGGYPFRAFSQLAFRGLVPPSRGAGSQNRAEIFWLNHTGDPQR